MKKDSELWFVKKRIISYVNMTNCLFRIQTDNMTYGAFCLINFACGTFCSVWTNLNLIFIILWCIWFQVSYSVYQLIFGVNDSNVNTQRLQRLNLYQTVLASLLLLRSVENTNFMNSKLQYTQEHEKSQTEHRQSRIRDVEEDLNLVPIVTGGFRTFCY